MLVDKERLTLVDGGLPGAGKKILNYIVSIGRDPSELERVIVTHGHPDHTGSLNRLVQVAGATIMAHPADTRRDGKTEFRRLHYPGQLPPLDWNAPFLRRIPVHELIEDGQVLPVLGGLEVMHTPGHTPGSVCLYLKDRQALFTGDTLIADGYCFRRPVPFPGTSFRDYRASVDRLALLPFEAACVGHGKPLGEGGAAALQEMLDHYFWLAPRWTWVKRQAQHLFSR